MLLDSVVVGAGQAGLAVARALQQADRSYRILEGADQAGGSWPAYYDSLTLFSPARYSALPGLEFPGDPDAYPRRDAVVHYLRDYARSFAIPVETGRRVTRVTRTDGHFTLEIDGGPAIHARSVIAASGAFAQPHVPELDGLRGFGGRVLHSRDYRSPEDFRGRRVIVIGGANSAVQIAHELAHVAHVTLASRRPIRFVPQRILGRDFHFWLRLTGLDYTRWLDDQSTPVIDDGRYRAAIAAGQPRRRAMFARVLADGVQWPDGSRDGADVLLFATGFSPSVAYLAELDVLDGRGQLRQRNGISTTTPGLYFAGFPKQRNFASATLRGVGPDAAHVVRHLQTYLAGQPRREALAHS